MEGGKAKTGELSAEAGVIPRAVRQIFDTLEAQKADYSVKVTFLELYNEEITDLLAPEDCGRNGDDKQKKPISLMEDGRGGVLVRGLEEEVVYSTNEIYNLLERGSSKRRSVDTLLNKHSSRSHSVFSISVHVKEATIGGEELIKCGKLNLVDLAGSENISRSGVRESRSREAGEINKSLLTLGRVINALVEHSTHVPYRDSKLTRLLRDSLGGKTKTCIIATISPSAPCLEETLSTLDYASRAKNIKNKPEANQKISKTLLLKDLYLEMERMRQDVRAAREKNGVYIPHERFAQDEADKKGMIEKIEKLAIEVELKGQQAGKFQNLYISEQEQKLDLECELRKCKMNLENCNKALQELHENHRIAISNLKDKDFIISNLQNSENSILERAKDLRTDLQNASEDIGVLFGEIGRKNNMESKNHILVLTFGSQLDQSLKCLHKTVLGSVSQQQHQLSCMEEHISSFLASKCDAIKVLESRMEKIRDTYTNGVRTMKELAERLQKGSSSNSKKIKSALAAQTMAVENFLVTAVNESEEIIHDIRSSLDDQNQLLDFFAQQQEEGLRRSLLSAQQLSKATTEFFTDLHFRSSRLLTFIEENQMEKSQKLADFKRTFKEESSREEKLTLEKIAIILKTLTSKKNSMVSTALKNMDEQNIEVKGRLQLEMLDIQKVSESANNEWDQYFKDVQNNFLEYTMSAAETKATMENNFQECSKRVDDSRKKWEDTQLFVNRLHEDGTEEIESLVKEGICASHDTLKELNSVSSSNNEEFNTRACDLLGDVNNSLMLDHEVKKEIDSMSTLCLEQLQLIQGNHGKGISNIRKQADQCLTKDYKVDHHNAKTPKRREIEVPTLTSLEELRTPAFEDLVAKLRCRNSSKGSIMGGKIQQEQCIVSPNRTPFAAVN